MQVRMRLLALLATLALVAAACGGDGGEEAVTPDTDGEAGSVAARINEIFGPGGEEAGAGLTLNIAVSASMTGPAAVFGQWQTQGIELAAKQIEEAGGPHFEIHVADHASGDVATGVTSFRRVLTQNDIHIASVSFGAIADALVPILQENEILALHGGGPSPFALFQDYVWNTRDLWVWDYVPAALNWLAEEHPDAKRLALVAHEENGIEGMRDLVPRVWEEEIGDGRVVSGLEIYEVGESDYSELIARVNATNPDAILTSAFGPDIGVQVKQFREVGLDVPLVGFDGGPTNLEFAEDAIDTLHISWDGYLPDPPNPFTKVLLDTYSAEYGEDPNFYSQNYYNDVFRFWELVRHVIAAGGDPTSGADLQQALMENPTQNSVYGGSTDEVGTLTYDLEAHIVPIPVNVYGYASSGEPTLAFEGEGLIPSKEPLRSLAEQGPG